ncbi:hypothetical protein FHR24_001218 [Wenyingzhuangia heitensis]|uniref:Uncharacterized protein n=1 Tax=Wenyingzhuangia heitensis TaxID=1487859 RepID=A0ABX0U7F6_9FLAO|nr:hypothetical protein [Wenyingzhuangia heitensis]NIJ44779.1 hypothetical protein [Wenyingzhuangia heitensis]
MKKIDLFCKAIITCVLGFSLALVSCTKSDTEVEDIITEEPEPVYLDKSITSAGFLVFDGVRSDNEYDFKYTPVIEVNGYNEDYNYELKLTGENFNEEYTLSLTEPTPKVDAGKEVGEILAALVAPTEPIVTTPKLQADITALDMEPDTYTVVILEKESNTELSVAGIDNATYVVVDSDATNFLSGTQLESDAWAKLSELNLNTHASFRVRPTIVNYINGIGVVLGIYNVDGSKIGYVSSNGSNGATQGTYSYKFQASKVDDLITEDGTYLLRLEERTSTIDANDTGYRNGLFQKIQITKLTKGGFLVDKSK